LVFFGFMWSWTRRLSPWHILLVGIPWAVLTSAIEYYLTLPWLQPWLMMQVPYWTALSVHLASAAVYPLLPLLRQGRGDPHPQRLRLSRWWGVGLMLALMGMGGLWALGESGHEVQWPFSSVQTDSPDGRFLIDMTAHHGVGLQLAQLAVVRSRASEVQDLGLLMAAEHKAEMARMHTWWQSWFQGDMPSITAQEYQQMVGMPPPDLLQRLQEIDGTPFDRLFLPIMLQHHEGAIVMCNWILQHGFDARTSLLALSIRHAQLQQMEEMRRLLRERSDDGSAAVPYTW
jgi:uncharacterized protein (DUF305 family)